MSAPQPRGKRGHRQWKGVSEGRQASTLMTNADVDEPPGLTRVENRGIGKTGPGHSGSGRRVHSTYTITFEVFAITNIITNMHKATQSVEIDEV